MKKLLLISMLIGAMPITMMAQDDDLYFASKKKTAKVEKVTEIAPVVAPQPKPKSSYEVIDGDTTKLDVIDFTEGKGVYPADSLETEDYSLTKKMMRFDDYDVSDNAAFWAGYNAGRTQFIWHSPWYYSRYGWGWYDPWYNSYWYNYYSPWYYSWYDPWYYGWYDPYYSPWGWPYYGYYGYYSPYWHYGYYGPGYYYGGGGGGGHHHYRGTGNAGTIDVAGSTGYHPSHRNTVTTNSSRMGSLRDRANTMGGGRIYSSGNTQRSSSGNFSGRRGGSTVYSGSSNSSSSSNRSSNSGFSNSNRSTNSTWSSGSSHSSSSSSGSFSSGSGGGSTRSSGGGGGGGHMGGRR